MKKNSHHALHSMYQEINIPDEVYLNLTGKAFPPPLLLYVVRQKISGSKIENFSVTVNPIIGVSIVMCCQSPPI